MLKKIKFIFINMYNIETWEKSNLLAIEPILHYAYIWNLHRQEAKVKMFLNMLYVSGKPCRFMQITI